MRKITNEELGRPSAEEFAAMEKMPVTVVLDNVRSAQNVGAFFRTGDAFAVERIVLCGITATPPSRDIHKTALGAEMTVPWSYCASTVGCIAQLRAEGYAVYAVEQEGTVWLLTSGGKIVETAAERGDTPLIDGCELLAPSLGGDVSFALELQNRQESLFALLTALESAELTGDVRAIHLGDPTVLSMDYTERFTVEMPYGADYPRLLRYLTLVIEELETNLTGVIDLTRDGEPHFRPN